MRARDKASDASYRQNIIDVDANPPPVVEDDDSGPAPQTFRERHALKVMGVIMAVMFATVIIAQMGC